MQEISQEEFFGLLRQTVDAEEMRRFFTPEEEWMRHVKNIGRSNGQYGAWDAYEHPTLSGWLLVEKTGRDPHDGHLHGSDSKFYVTDEEGYRGLE